MSKDVWKVLESTGGILSAATLSTFVGIESGPAALCGFRSCSSSITSFKPSRKHAYIILTPSNPTFI